jgi:DNA-binding transcriptional MerR regulator
MRPVPTVRAAPATAATTQITSSKPPPGRHFRRIGDVARATGLTPRAIRHYESIGLLRPAVRSEGANRFFDDLDVDRLIAIRRLRDVLGFSLAEIREMIENENQRDQMRADLKAALNPADQRALLGALRRLAARRLVLIEAKIGQLDHLRQEEIGRIARLDDRAARIGGLDA